MDKPALFDSAIELAEGELRQLETLADALTREQALWASGYLAGVAHARRAGSTPATGLPATTPAEIAPARSGTEAALSILFASETGNAEELARRFELRARAAGFAAEARDVAALKARDVRALEDAGVLVMVTSTHGDGDPPEPAAGFFELLASRKAPKLDRVQFAVLGLGDSTYEYFCQAAKDLDRRFEELGGCRLHDRIDCDLDYDEPAVAWIEAVLEKLRAARAEASAATEAATAAAGTVPVRDGSHAVDAASAYGRRRPFDAPVLEKLTVTGRGSSKQILHVELGIEGSGLAYEPGDSLGIVPRNDPALVGALIECCALDGDEPLGNGRGSTTLHEALLGDYEISTLTPRFLQHWADVASVPALAALTVPEHRAEMMEFLRGHHVIDVVRAHPVPGLDGETLTAGLRRLQPRLYSIASSPIACEGEAHITVSAVRYRLHGDDRTGVASCLLADRVEAGDSLPVYVQRNDRFRLPADPDAPIVMIGAGTGVAPFRAFVQHREALGATGRSWLFFGERNFRTDFLYQTEWQEWLRAGALTRMHVAFSRDQAAKRYVQHAMAENAADLFAWLEEGAHLYVCGDAEKLAPDVHRALLGVLQSAGSMTHDEAAEYVRDLQAGGRYQRDVY